MSDDKIKIMFPGSIDLLVKITNGEKQGTVTIGYAVGKIPTKEEIIGRIRQFEQDGSMPAGYRFMTKREVWDDFCIDEFGQRFAMPGQQEFDE